jgi:hypothetical protein
MKMGNLGMELIEQAKEVKKANYRVSYTSGATGCGWTEEVDTIEEVKELVGEIRFKSSAMVTVWSKKHEDYIFYKDCLSSPETDLIFTNGKSDLRTKTGIMK